MDLREWNREMDMDIMDLREWNGLCCGSPRYARVSNRPYSSLLWDSSICEGPSCLYMWVPRVWSLTTETIHLHDDFILSDPWYPYPSHDFILSDPWYPSHDISIGLSTIMDHLPLHLKSEMFNPKRADFEIMAIIGPDTAAFKIANIRHGTRIYFGIFG